MIEFYHRIAKAIFPFRLVLWAFLLVSTLRAGMIVLSNTSAYDGQLLTMLVFSIWFILSLSICYFFRNIAVKPERKLGILRKLAIFIQRKFSVLIAIFFSVLSLLVMVFTFKAVSFLFE
jgi:hypothetical protein